MGMGRGHQDVNTFVFLIDSQLQTTTRQSLRIVLYETKVSHRPRGEKMGGWEEFAGGKRKCFESAQSTRLPGQLHS